MATKTRHQTYLINQWKDDIGSFEFHQVVRLLKRFLKKSSGGLQFQVAPDLGFPVAELAKLTVHEDDGHPQKFQLLVTFMGLIGQSGALPEAYTELLLERLYVKDKTLLIFLDLFHNKLLHLFYEASTLSRYYLAHEVGKPHAVTDMLGALSGENKKHYADPALYYAGLLSMQTRSAEGLRLMLQNYFELPITINQFSPQWFSLGKDEVTRLSKDNRNNHLGQNIIVGKRIWHVQNKFTVIVSLSDYATLKRLLPSGDMLPDLNDMIKAYVGLEYDYCIQLKISSRLLPKACLNKGCSSKLGEGIVLKHKPFHEETITIKVSTQKLKAA